MRKIILFGWVVLIVCISIPLTKITTQSNISIDNPIVYLSETNSNTHSNLDPATNYEPRGGGLIQVIYEGLLRYDGNSYNIYAPSLAYTNYTISPDGLNYTFYLRSDVNFSDGSPFNAYVMQYSIQRAIIMNDPASGIWIPSSVIRDGPRMYYTPDLNVSEAKQFLANMSIIAQGDTILSIALEQPTSTFIPSIIFSACDAISPHAVISNEPSRYTTNQADDVYGMVSLLDMFPTLDEDTIRTKLGLGILADLNNSGIVPQSDVGSPSDYNWDGTKMPGTGPYILTTDISGNSTIMQKNKNWWNKGNFNPLSPDIVEIRQVSETATRILDLKNGNAVSVYIPSANLNDVINTTTISPLYDSLNVFTYPSLTIGFLTFNQNATLPASEIIQINDQYSASYIKSNNIVQYSWLNSTGGIQYASPGNPFTSLLFRKAFAYTFDYDSYIKDITNNIDSRLQGVIPKGLLGHQDDLIEQGYIPKQNLSLAKELFQEVNWQGYVTISYNSGSIARQKASQLLKNTIADLNVGITVLIQEISNFGFFQPYDYYLYRSALCFYGWAPDYAHASDYTFPILHSDGAINRYYRYLNPFVDSLMEQADSSDNNTLRNQLYREMEINASQDFPMIYLNQVNNVIVLSKMVTGIENPISGSYNYFNLGPNYQYLGLDPSVLPPTVSSDYPPESTSTIFFTITESSSSEITTTSQSNINKSFINNFDNYLQTALISGILVFIPSVLLGLSFEYRKAVTRSKINGNNNYSFKDFIRKTKTHKTILSEDTLKKLQKLIDETSKK